MADAVLLRKAVMKVVWFIVVVAVGRWLLWPDLPVREWLETQGDWKIKFAFIGWAALSVGMAYDAVAALVRGVIATPGAPNRR
jgi:hypothetical protein